MVRPGEVWFRSPRNQTFQGLAGFMLFAGFRYEPQVLEGLFDRYAPSFAGVGAVLVLVWQLTQFLQLHPDSPVPLVDHGNAISTATLAREHVRQEGQQFQQSSPGPVLPGRYLAQLTTIPLFGEDASWTGTPQPALPVTPLNLTLIGTLEQARPQVARAIVRVGTGTEDVYRVGDRIPVASVAVPVVVQAIHSDHVILARAGRLEILTLPFAEHLTARVPADVTPRGSGRDTVQEFEHWRFSPEQILDSVHARFIESKGVLQGIEIRPLRNARAFNRSGFRPGDVIVSVEGMPVSALDSTDGLLTQLMHHTSVRVQVQRNGQEIIVELQLTD